MASSRSRRCRNLSTLSLNQTSVTDDGLMKLSACKSLKKLELRQTPVSKKGVAKLKQACQAAGDVRRVSV